MSMIGVELGGDPKNLRALADWLTNEVLANLDECGTAARRSYDALWEVWSDDAGEKVLPRMKRGVKDTFALAHAVSALASDLRTSADVLEAEQHRVEDLTEQAARNGLMVRDGYIEGPNESSDAYLPSGPDGPRQDSLERYQQRSDAFDAASGSMNGIVDRLVAEAERLEDEAENVWRDIFHAINAFTSAGTHLQRHRINNGARANPFSRIAARGGPALTIIGIVYDIQTGDSTRKALTSGVSSLAGGAAGFKSGMMLVSLATPAGWAIVAGGIIGSFGLATLGSIGAESVCDHFDPETAHNRVQRHLESA